MVEVDWALLKALRAGFLSERPGGSGDYWVSGAALESYDVTFGERIGWKWDSVLAEVVARGWQVPEGATLIDFGCGTGIASRRMLSVFGADRFSSLLVHDRSTRAERFALDEARKVAPSLASGSLRESTAGEPVVLVLSHVLNELSEAAEREVMRLARDAAVIFWVEPGTPVSSERLIAVREDLRETFDVVAPCTHREACGLLVEARKRDWCHHFAKAAPEAFTSSHWSRFGKELGVDVRSLPVSFLVLDRRPSSPSGAARVVGRPRRRKGYTTYLACDETGVADSRAQKRTEPITFEALKDEAFTYLLPEGDRR